MKKKLGAGIAVLAGLGLVVVPMVVADADVTITVPTAAIPQLQAVCADVKAREGYATFTNPQCLEYFLKAGLRQYVKQTRRQEAAALIDADLAGIEAAFPEPE